MRLSMQNGLAAMILLVSIFIVTTSGLALPETSALVSEVQRFTNFRATLTFKQVPDACSRVDGHLVCTPQGTTSGVLDAEPSRNLSLTLTERDEGKIVCGGPKQVPINFNGVKTGWIDKFCKDMDNVELRAHSVSVTRVAHAIKMRLYVGTQDEWIYAMEKNLCGEMFMRIVRECSFPSVFGKCSVYDPRTE